MKTTPKMFNKIAFIMGWPILFLLLRWSHRSRVLIIYDAKVLLVKGWLGIRKNETPKQSAAREVKEEVGIHLSLKQLQSIGEGTHYYRGLKYHYYKYVAVLNKQPDISGKSHEIIEATWLPLKELSESNAEPVTLEVISTWLGQHNRDTL
jgi:8-oxo-dGTP pyrophosphatase MutT (NUDIX family)